MSFLDGAGDAPLVEGDVVRDALRLLYRKKASVWD